MGQLFFMPQRGRRFTEYFFPAVIGHDKFSPRSDSGTDCEFASSVTLPELKARVLPKLRLLKRVVQIIHRTESEDHLGWPLYRNYVYQVLECGHIVAAFPWQGQPKEKRRNCTACASQAQDLKLRKEIA